MLYWGLEPCFLFLFFYALGADFFFFFSGSYLCPLGVGSTITTWRPRLSMQDTSSEQQLTFGSRSHGGGYSNGTNGYSNGYGGGYGGGGYGRGGGGGDRMANLGANLKRQDWGKPICIWMSE